MISSVPARLLLASLLVAATVRGQQPTAPPPVPADANGEYTLHVYPTLFQIPTLLLPQNPVFPITDTFQASDFSISVDSGPQFHPETVRRAGNDLLDIEILLDAGGDQNDFLKTFAPALGAAVGSELHPEDRITVYALDCKLLNTSPMEAAAPERVEDAVTRLLNDPRLHGDRPHSNCQSKLALWDSIAIASNKFPARPSRRVMLIVSEGDDGKSTLTFEKMTVFLRAGGVAVFGLRNSLIHDAEAPNKERLYHLGLATYPDFLATLVALDGGRIYDSLNAKPDVVLKQFLRDLRDRYILEFEAPADPHAGLHSIAIQVTHDRAIAHPAPLSAAIPDPARATDPTVLHSGTRAPVFGTKQPKQ